MESDLDMPVFSFGILWTHFMLRHEFQTKTVMSRSDPKLLTPSFGWALARLAAAANWKSWCAQRVCGSHTRHCRGIDLQLVLAGRLNFGGQPCGVVLLGRGHCAPSHGLITVSPAASKGLVSRVAMVKLLAMATAAMKASAVSMAKPAALDLASSSA